MSFVAAAVIGGSVIGAGATIYGANKAANAQTNAANAGIAAQREMFDIAKGEAQPFIDFGKSQTGAAQSFSDVNDPNSPLAKLLALVSPGSNQTAALEQTPGFQFANEYGQKAVQNALAARGLGGPGGALARGGADYAEGLAGTTWQSVVNALQNAYSAGSGSLQNMVNTGANSAASLGGVATNTGQGISNNLIGAGNAQAGAATATGSALANVGNSVSSAVLLKNLLGGGSSSGGSIYNGASKGFG